MGDYGARHPTPPGERIVPDLKPQWSSDAVSSERYQQIMRERQVLFHRDRTCRETTMHNLLAQ
jgi:hypothetical protein